jgi:membrane-associated phospholipid phosphatase
MGFLARRKHLFLLLIYPLVGLGFLFCKVMVTTPTYWIEWPLVDRAIPFLPFMVWPYVSWYFVVAFPFAWLGLRDSREFVRYCCFIFGGMTSAYVIYLLFPNGIALRPSFAVLGSGWEYDALRWVYTNSTPRNVSPSIHVINTWGVLFALYRDKTLGRSPWVRGLLALLCAAIVVSTVTIKQHSVIDIFTGTVWAAVCYFFCYSRRSPFFSGTEQGLRT